MSRGKICRERIFVFELSLNYSHRGGNFERGKKALSFHSGRETVWEAFQETIWARVTARSSSSVATPCSSN